MPVVPRIESPPMIPSRAFIVFSARRSPPGIEIVTVRSGGGAPISAAASMSMSRINARGAGLIAGSPTASERPARVTVPTPSPAANPMPEPGAAHAVSAIISAPCVMSGSSPASLTTPARAPVPLSSARASGKVAVPPRGNRIATGSGKRPVSIAAKAAREAAAAQAPVVQPRRSAGLSSRAITDLSKTGEDDYLLACRQPHRHPPRIQDGDGARPSLREAVSK